MRISAAILVLISFVYAGVISANSARDYLRILITVKDCILLIKNTLSVKNDPLPELFERLAEGSGEEYEFFSNLMYSMKRIGQVSFSVLWDEALILTFPNLEAADKRELSRLGMYLGKTDTESQLDALSECFMYFRLKSEKLSEELPNKTKVRFTVWTAAGAMGLILLI